ncbi:SH3 domain-containing protein [Thiohalobacter sp. IOR34]|uniref:SH3 domain-containing protein n=1 Tax=Thiohalobacter sp. IOR34 TaxID=3057176 RepID=UPI0025B1244D|nr:SH3 domain-containing protein [Thiohalobacter sp. IOR34]WJW76120.1 SH3 domain-containing protein [Thiohalobacter sp. IOR34]
MNTQTKLGGGGSEVTGSGGNAGAQGQSTQLVHCARPIGTAALLEPEDRGYAQYGLSSPVPLIRLMMAQSNCFRVVDRGAASSALQRERALAAGGELQKGSSMGGGQMVAADYIITPSIIFQDANAGGGFGGLGALLPGVAGAVAGGIRTQNLESQVTLFVTNVRTGVQEAVAEGSAKKSDISFGGFGWMGGVAGGGGAYQSTDIGKITAAAFMDAHNKLVAQLQATQPAAMAPDAAGYMTSTGVNFRSGPTTSAPILAKLPKGTPVRPTGTKRGDWWEVEARGLTGWLHSNFITR